MWHVPSYSKDLLWLHHIALDKHVFPEFHPYIFLIKDKAVSRYMRARTLSIDSSIQKIQ